MQHFPAYHPATISIPASCTAIVIRRTSLQTAVPSGAQNIAEIIQELLAARTSEREGRVIDRDGGASMEMKKMEGYF